MSEEPNIPTEGEDNSTISQMRMQIKSLTQENRAKDTEIGSFRAAISGHEAKLAELAPLASEHEQLRREHEAKLTELTDLGSVKAEKERFEGVLEKLFGEELARVPDDRRESLLKLVGEGSWDVRLLNLREAVKPLPGREPLRIGSSTQAGTPGAGTGSTTMFDPKNPPSWSQALKR